MSHPFSHIKEDTRTHPQWGTLIIIKNENDQGYAARAQELQLLLIIFSIT